jgi:LPPG:FO 2-phospho-L-lactate transferase
MIVALAGGVGAARFLDGLVRVVRPPDVFVIGNTGDDAEIQGLHISPDLDTVTYTLAGLANPSQGWGVAGDTLNCHNALKRLGEDMWFLLGDQDLATHLYRTERLRQGQPLSRITAEVARNLGIRSLVCPMSDDPVRTVVTTPAGPLDFQTYFVRRRARDPVKAIEFRGAPESKPAPGVLKAIRNATGIVFCPSNPLISLGPILAVPGIRAAIERRKCKSVAISPIVGGRALKGPAAEMLRGLGIEVSARGVAERYRDLVDVFVLDREDRQLASPIEKLGMKVVVTDTIMTGLAQKKALARAALKGIRAA